MKREDNHSKPFDAFRRNLTKFRQHFIFNQNSYRTNVIFEWTSCLRLSTKWYWTVTNPRDFYRITYSFVANDRFVSDTISSYIVNHLSAQPDSGYRRTKCVFACIFCLTWSFHVKHGNHKQICLLSLLSSNTQLCLGIDWKASCY